MQATVLGVQLDENDASVLKMALDVKDKKINYLTPKKVEGKDGILYKLMKNDLILKAIAKGGHARYSISDKGVKAYDLLPPEMIKLCSPKKSKTLKKDGMLELKASVDEMNKKLDKILLFLTSSQASTGKGNGSSEKHKAFESQLVDEYKKLRVREFLSDGKVWHDQLKHIIMDRYSYKDYEYDELLQHLKETNIGMVSISQGKDKTWIEIRA
jgi:hypothetical protein